MVCVQLVFDSAWSQGPPVQENLNRNMEICLHFFLQTSKDVAESFEDGRSLFVSSLVSELQHLRIGKV